jgi:hypothetical protein
MATHCIRTHAAYLDSDNQSSRSLEKAEIGSNGSKFAKQNLAEEVSGSVYYRYVQSGPARPWDGEKKLRYVAGPQDSVRPLTDHCLLARDASVTSALKTDGGSGDGGERAPADACGGVRWFPPRKVERTQDIYILMIPRVPLVAGAL